MTGHIFQECLNASLPKTGITMVDFSNLLKLEDDMT
jgi:hypothetical protein